MNTDSMNVKRTKHDERSEATRAALMAAARPLFADRGFAGVGTERAREIGLRHSVGLVEAALQAAVEAGQLAPQPVRGLAHILIGAVDEAALYVATSDDQVAARAEVGAVLDRLLQTLS
jgi:type VI protein secretion system component VasF